MSLIAEKVPLLLIAVILSVAESRAQIDIGAASSLAGIPLIYRVNNAMVCYVIYIVKLAVPTDLAVFYPHPGARPVSSVLAALGVLCLISWGCWRPRRARPYAIVGWLWFLGALAPVIGLVQVGSQAMADRYSYLPFVGLFIVVVWGFADLIRIRLIRQITATGVIAVFAAMAHRQVSYWRDSETLFTHAAAVTDDNPPAHVGLGKLAFERHDLRRAVDECNLALRYRENAEAYRGLGMCWLADDRPKSIAFFRRALALRPRDPGLKLQLAKALQLNGELDAALQLATSARASDPDNPEAIAEVDFLIVEKAKHKPL